MITMAARSTCSIADVEERQGLDESRQYSDVTCDAIAATMAPQFAKLLNPTKGWKWGVMQWIIPTERNTLSLRIARDASESRSTIRRGHAQKLLAANQVDRDAIVMRCLNRILSYHAWTLYFELILTGHRDLPYPVFPLEQKDNDGCSLLHLVIPMGRPEFIRYLLGEGASAWTTDASGQTPLHVHAASLFLSEIQNQTPEIVQSLLQHGADINAQDQFGRTPLHVAIEMGNYAAAAQLLTSGANPWIRDQHGWAPADHISQIDSDRIRPLLEASILGMALSSKKNPQRKRL